MDSREAKNSNHPTKVTQLKGIPTVLTAKKERLLPFFNCFPEKHIFFLSEIVFILLLSFF